MSQPLDKETQKVQNDSEANYRFVKSDDWKIVKSRLIEKIIILDSLSYLRDEQRKKKTPMTVEEIGRWALIRQEVVDTILSWINEIEGDARDFEVRTRQMIKEIKEESIVVSID